MSSKSTAWHSPPGISPVAVTVTGREEVYLLAHKHCDYPALLKFVHAKFGVSGDPECVWIERHKNYGTKFLLDLDQWNEYSGIIDANKLLFQFPAAGGVCNTIRRFGNKLQGGRFVSLYRDKYPWTEVSNMIREATQIPRGTISQFVVKEPYPEWWIERFGQDWVIEEKTWQRIVEVACRFAQDRITDLQVQLVHYL
ncbi:hypothetical protein K440DRAFT_642287 [Wilcoxina mikolae CBS 423.85]|nr:hypothetical protein K440DRAFT_642287 [Wilcoxina mikolae CBS 423.85]